MLHEFQTWKISCISVCKWILVISTSLLLIIIIIIIMSLSVIIIIIRLAEKGAEVQMPSGQLGF